MSGQISFIVSGTFILGAWLVSALLSVRLFLQLATNPVSRFILVALALTLEAGKYLAVRRFREHRRYGLALLAGALVLLSLLASVGSALELMTERRIERNQVVNAMERLAGEQERLEQGLILLDRQTQAVLAKLEQTPADWAGTVRSLRQDLEKLREERNILLERLGGNGQVETQISTLTVFQADMFDLLGDALGLKAEILTLGYLLLVALCLEAIIVISNITDIPPCSTEKGEKKTSPAVAKTSSHSNKLSHLPVPLGNKLASGLKCNQDAIPQGENSLEVQVGNHSTRRKLPMHSQYTPEEVQRCTGEPRRPGRPKKELDVERLLPVFSSLILSSMDEHGRASVSRDQAAQELGLSSWAGKALYREAVERKLFQPRGRRTVSVVMGTTV